MRALAVILVVLYHLPPQWNLGGGFVGVDVFFVISGYVITRSLGNRVGNGSTLPATYGHFLRRRMRRLVPALAVLVAAGVALAFLFSPVSTFPGEQRASWYSATFTANVFFLRNFDTYWNPEILRNPFLHLWSLGVEFQVYLVWPLVLLGLGSRPRRLRTLPLAVLSCASLVAFVWLLRFRSAPVAGYSPGGVAFYSPFTRFWELGLGGILALRKPHLSVRSPRRVITFRLAGASLITWSVLELTRADGLSLWVVAACAGTALLLAAEGPEMKGRAATLLCWVGDRSYSIYLWHWPLLAAALWTQPGSLAWAVGAVGVAVVLAHVSYEVLERGRLARRTRVLSPWVFLVPSLAVLLAANQVSRTEWFNHTRTLSEVAVRFADNGPTGDDMMGSVTTCAEIPAGMECANFPERDDRIMIIGDSLGYRSLPAVQFWARKHGYNTTMMWTGGCTFSKDSCTEAIGRIIYDYMAAHKIAAIIVASNFDKPADRVNGSEKAAGRNPVCSVPTRSCPEHREWVARFERGAVPGLDQLARISPNILVALPFPQQAELVDTCLQAPVYRRILGSSLGDTCGRTSIEWQHARQGLIPGVIEASVAARPGVRLWDPMDYLCADGWCPAVINDGERIMDDAIHWSWPAARLIAGPISGFLDSSHLPVLG